MRQLVFIICVLSFPPLDVVQGEVIFLGPMPYRSAADSPFDRSGLGSTFFLEDFEDGTVDFPAGVDMWPGFIREASNVTDSVDADDGLIDGTGSAGHSFVPTVVGATFSFPPIWSTYYRVNFDAGILGTLPTFAGLVVTDGKPSSDNFFSGFTVLIRDGNGRISNRVFPTEMDNSSNGEVIEDRFFGVAAPEGILEFSVTSFYEALHFDEYRYEIDHVQFGFGVPEPLLGTLFQVLVSIIACKWLSQRR